jgi:hypothetical protein
MYCNLSPNPIYFYNDLYFECADDSYNFNKPFNMYGNEGIRYMCSTSATFPASSTLVDSKVIPDVAIVTDDFWLQDTVDECFTISRAPTAPVSSPVSPPTTVTDVPTTALPVQTPLIPTLSPTGQPPSTITMVPLIQTLSPTTMPVVLQPRENPQNTSSDSTAPVGAIAGGIIGGLAIGVVVMGFLLFQKRQNNTINHSPKPHVIEEPTTTRIDSANGQDPSSSSNTGHPVAAAYGATVSSIGSSHAATPASQPQHAVNMSSTAAAAATNVIPTPPPSYEVNYKDQSRTVVGQPKPMPMPTVEAVPMQTQIPIAVAMDVSAASGGSNTTRSEPPGRRMEEP